MKVVTFKEKSVYGRTLIYPACESSKLFVALLGQATIGQREYNLIQQLADKLGFKVELIPLP